MKRLIYPISMMLILAAIAPDVKATGISGETNSPHIIHSNSHHSYGITGLTNHHFEIHVEGQALTKLSIELPARLDISRGLKITDSRGSSIKTNVTINKERATFEFAEPLPEGTIVSIDLLGVKTSNIGLNDRIWQYRIFGNLVEFNQEIILGIRTIKTDDD